MRAVVVTPPDPIVTPDEISGTHDANDTVVAALIAAVTEEIDGPGGYLNRSLGLQTIRATSWCFEDGMTLPAGPVTDIESLTYLDANGDEQTVDPSYYRLAGDRLYAVGGYTFPTTLAADDAVRVTYNAGYDGVVTGAIPERARSAIILSVQSLKAGMAIENVFLKTDVVEGIGRQEYVLSDQATAAVQATCRRLLSTLWMPSV